jgi:hypothetical protein
MKQLKFNDERSNYASKAVFSLLTEYNTTLEEILYVVKCHTQVLNMSDYVGFLETATRLLDYDYPLLNDYWVYMDSISFVNLKLECISDTIDELLFLDDSWMCSIVDVLGRYFSEAFVADWETQQDKTAMKKVSLLLLQAAEYGA